MKFTFNVNVSEDYNVPKLGKGDYSINDIKEFIRKKRLMSRYAKTGVNPAFYNKHTLPDSNTPHYGQPHFGEIKFLTDEEFRAGKQGYVLANFKTNS